MEILIKRKLSAAITALVLISATAFSQAPPVTTIGTPAYSLGTWQVPVTVSGFNNVGSISLTILYDNTKVSYTGITLNSGLFTASPVVTPTTDQSGVFRFSVTSVSAITLGSPVNTLLILSFTSLPGVEGVRTLLTWSTAQGDNDITPPHPAVFVPQINTGNQSTYFIDGFINIPPVPVISGPASAATGSTGNIYSTASGMTGYIWTVSAGGTITGGAGTNAITITWDLAGVQNVSVTYTHPVAGPALVPSNYQVNVVSGGSISLNLVLFLEGLYTGGRTMRKAQGAAGDQYPGLTTDVIIVELHDAASYPVVIFSASGINLNTNGQAFVNVPPAFNGSYYITVKHRNSIVTVSAAPVSFASGTVNYDFSTLSSQTFGGNVKNSGGVFLIYAGDVGQDGFVGVADMGNVDNQSAIFATGYLPEDVDGDGFVGVADMGLIDNNSTAFVFAITP